jgi:hypothetical protein
MDASRLKQIYDEGMGHSVANAVQAIYLAAVAETHQLRDELAAELGTVDIAALQAENAELKAGLASAHQALVDAQAMIDGLKAEVEAAHTPQEPPIAGNAAVYIEGQPAPSEQTIQPHEDGQEHQ